MGGENKVKMTEEEFAFGVEDLLEIYHWLWCHFRPARTIRGWRTAVTGHKGLPDYIAARPPRLLFFELKSEDGKLTPEQEEWLEALRGCQIVSSIGEPVSGKMALHRFIPEVYLWRPSQYDELQEILK